MEDMQALFPISLPLSRPDDKDVQKYNDEVRYHENCLNQNNVFLQNKISELVQTINNLQIQISALS